MTVYNFIWDMTEEQWKSYMEVCKKTKLDDYDVDMYGQLWCGDVCFEFMLYDVVAYCCTSYVYGKDGGYADTSDGVSYDLVDNDIKIPLDCDSFEEFQIRIVSQIASMASADDNWRTWLTAETHRWH